MDAPCQNRLSIGDVVQTNYGTGPYRVIDIKRGCTCQNYLDALEFGGDEAPRSASHMHLTCVTSSTPTQKRYRGRELRWLNGFVETSDGRIVSVWSDDELCIVAPHGVLARRFYCATTRHGSPVQETRP